MRLVINAWFWDQPNTGSGQYIRNLLPAMRAFAPKLDITLLTPRPPDDVPGGVRVVVKPPRLGGHMGKLWFEQHTFPAACRGADLAHVPYWGPPLRAPVPFIVTVHDIIPAVRPAYRGGMLARAYTALARAATPGAALILTDSNASRQDIMMHIGVPAEQVRTVYLAASDVFCATPGPGDPAVRAKYGLPERFVLYLGGFDVRKNVIALLSAYAYVGEATGGEVPLVLAGRMLRTDTARFPALHPHIKALGLTDVVHILGWVDEADKPALMRMASCFVFPSRYEGFGLPPLEAMACGTPVVAADASSIPEVVGDAGFLVPPDDVRALAGAILAVLTEDDFAAALRMRGLIQAARFSWEQSARATLAAYEDALSP